MHLEFLGMDRRGLDKHSCATLHDGWQLPAQSSPELSFSCCDDVIPLASLSCWTPPGWHQDILIWSVKQLEWWSFHLQAWGYDPHLEKWRLPVPGSAWAAASSETLKYLGVWFVCSVWTFLDHPVDCYWLCQINALWPLFESTNCTVSIHL